MSEWVVTCTGSVREYYVVEAETREEAMKNWASGTLDYSEAEGVGADSAVPNV